MARAAQPLNPYNSVEINAAQAVIDSGKDTLELIAKCQDCGVEMAALAEQTKALMAFAEGVLRNFKQGAEGNA